MDHTLRAAIRLLLAFAVTATGALAAALTAAPAPAMGAQAALESPGLSERAQVQTTGTLHVVEQRMFTFSQPTDMLRWDFTGLPEDSEVDVAAVRMAEVNEAGDVQGAWQTLAQTSFNSSWRDASDNASGLIDREFASVAVEDALSIPRLGTWALDKWQYSMYVFFEQPAQHVIFEIDWSATDAVAAYDDVAELYWDYVPAREDALTLDVVASIQLSVPKSAQVEPGETVVAWGHGAPGEVDVAADGTVMYRVPEVRPGQYAQAHILFPSAWLTNLSAEARAAHSGTRLDLAKAEEEAWTDTYSNQKANGFAVDGAVALICAIVLAAVGALYAAWGREPKPDELPELSPDELARLTRDQALIDRFIAWNHVGAGESDPEAVSERVAEAGLFDARSFRMQKILFIAAVVVICAALVVLIATLDLLAAAMLLVTGICVAIMANYMPRRTPKGAALAVALNAAV